MTGAEEAAASGVAHGEELIRLCEAMVASDDAALAGARDEALAALGPAAFVDAAAVASNFQRMVRIADGTGIPLDTPMQIVTEDLREQLGLERFGASANTPASGPAIRLLGRVVAPLASRVVRLVAALWNRKG